MTRGFASQTPGADGGIRVTFGMIVLNAEPFVLYNLRALYPFAHEIIVVEGAAPAGRAVSTADGHSSDGTLDTLRRFQATEDPDGKVVIVTAESDGHADGFWKEKDDMSRAYAKRATGNYLWQIDADEFYRPADIRAVLAMLATDNSITAVSFHMRTFWGAPTYVVDSFFLRRFVAHRLFAWGPGYQYTTHRPPTVVDALGRDVRRDGKSISAAAMKRKGIFLYHYELLLPKQVGEKARYYAAVEWSDALRGAEAWVQSCYATISRPFRVHMEYDRVSWLRRYTGEQPPQIALMVRAIVAGAHPGITLRRTDDIERLLSARSYLARRAALEMLAPFYAAFASAKAGSRRILQHTPLWRGLQVARRALVPRRG